MIFFFDTETTGLVDWRMAPDHESQPHLVQFAGLLCEDDGQERASVSMIVKPDGYEIPEGAANVHGITTDIAARLGHPLALILDVFESLSAQARSFVGHNINFDIKVMESALSRSAGRLRQLEAIPTLCTMKTATPICRIPHARPRGPNDFKWPKLEECIRHFFDEELEGAHDALADVRGCKRVYFHLKDMGVIE